MSKLAQKVAPKVKDVPPRPGLPGPRNECFPLYSYGDLEDWEAVEALRVTEKDWRGAQRYIDDILGITEHLDLEKFRYHWRRRCACWPKGLRL